MDLIEFFNSDELEVPRSWEAYQGSFEQFIEHIFGNYQRTLQQIKGTDYLSGHIVQASRHAAALCDELRKCLNEYHLGHPHRAYSVLDKILQRMSPYIIAMSSLPDIWQELDYLYRIRVDPRRTLSRGDIFHVPFEQRHKVATYRYSIPGLPCLYLGGSAYVCWEEYDRPNLDEVHLARFHAIAGSNLQVLDFGWRTARWAGLISEIRFRPQLSQDSPLSRLLTAHALCWPLVASCSIKVRHQKAPFKPEYIIPQLLLQWLRDETKIDGVRYFTTKVALYHPDPVSVANFAFPVRSTKPTGYCDQLAAKFELSEPLRWPAVCTTAPAIGNTLHSNFEVATGTPYNSTELGRLQHCAARLACARI